jgi:SAM-dependent methyltransferase
MLPDIARRYASAVGREPDGQHGASRAAVHGRRTAVSPPRRHPRWTVPDRCGRRRASTRSRREQQRLHLLEQMLDPDTIRTLERCGIQPSWRCLELGAGAGSIAHWLAARCPDGQVVATDLGTTFLAARSAPNLQVLRHDVVAEDFPLGSFDLIHARWLLVNESETFRGRQRSWVGVDQRRRTAPWSRWARIA